MGRYDRDPHYGRQPAWGRLYARHFPLDTDACSRHVKVIAQHMLRDRNSPVRKMLMDAGYEPDHWAESMELTVQELWRLRAEKRLLSDNGIRESNNG